MPNFKTCFIAAFRRAALAAVTVLVACAETAPVGESYPPLWKITAPDGMEAHLFGSVHMLPKNIAWRSPAFEAAFAQADRLVLEVSAAELSSSAAASHIAAHGRLPANETLADHLTPKDYATVMAAAETYSLSETQFIRTAPWLATLQLAVSAVAADGGAAEAGVETVLAADAKVLGVPVEGLEQLDDHLDTLSGLPMAAQVDMLVQTAEDAAAGPIRIDALVAVWRTGDLARLETELLGPLKENAALYDALIAKRNKAWTEKIVRFDANDGRPFIAVGAAHLPGEDGLLTLLHAEGFRVEMVR
ncbi:MAG: TraB/GumN family protein [Pseudomonadota bacterium]